MKYLIMLMMAVFVFLSCRYNLSARDAVLSLYLREIEAVSGEWDEYRDRELGAWERLNAEPDDSWSGRNEMETQEWTELKDKVHMKWRKFVHSSKTVWVAYDEEANTRSSVDFDKGKIVVATTVPVRSSIAEREAKRNIARQVKQIICNGTVLENQVSGKKGEIINDKNIETFIREQVLDSVTAVSQTFRGGDNIIRRTYTTAIPLVTDHIRIRAKKYIPLVKKSASRFNLSPELIMAIIQAESCFNPMALSSCGACGLMQVLPGQGGRDAYLFVFGKDKIVSRKFLYQPLNNILLGSAYLYLLKNKYFCDIKDKLKNRYLSICGYNWGPTAVRERILNRYSFSGLNRPEAFELLKQKSPKETGRYLQQVIRMIPAYDPFFI